MIGTVVAATFAVFIAVEISIPGGFKTAVLPVGMSESSPRARQIIEAYDLDGNVFTRYGSWLWGVLQGDFGRSTRAGTPVVEILTHRLPISIQIMLAGVLVTVLVGVPLGLLAASRAGTRTGRIVDTILGLSQSIPVYLTPIFLVWVFSLRLRWLPAAGWVRISDSLWGNMRNLLMPAAALAFAEIGVVGRVVRADALTVLQTDYIAAAVGKGLRSRYIMLRHVLRPASLGLLNVIALNIGTLLSGVVIIEIIFGIGGLGQVLLEATINRDLFLILGLTTYMVGVYVILNAIADVAMLAVDPRIRRPH